MAKKKENSPLPAAAARCFADCLVDTKFGSDPCSDDVAVEFWLQADWTLCTRRVWKAGLLSFDGELKHEQHRVRLHVHVFEAKLSVLTCGSKHGQRSSHVWLTDTGSSCTGTTDEKTRSIFRRLHKLDQIIFPCFLFYHFPQRFVCSTPPGTLR